MMKKYIRPEMELVKFGTEVIADQLNGDDSAEDNLLSGDLT